jgi:hypothetical protein
MKNTNQKKNTKKHVHQGWNLKSNPPVKFDDMNKAWTSWLEFEIQPANQI